MAGCGAPSALAPLFGDVCDRARRLSDEVTMLGEALDGLLNVNLARVTVRQNVIIQQVSAWAAIAAAATIITGIYGMNFRTCLSSLGLGLPDGDHDHDRLCHAPPVLPNMGWLG